ncbi:hypothetical protein RFI_01269, partial [Reticulomyxa filosa]
NVSTRETEKEIIETFKKWNMMWRKNDIFEHRKCKKGIERRLLVLDITWQSVSTMINIEIVQDHTSISARIALESIISPKIVSRKESANDCYHKRNAKRMICILCKGNHSRDSILCPIIQKTMPNIGQRQERNQMNRRIRQNSQQDEITQMIPDMLGSVVNRSILQLYLILDPIPSGVFCPNMVH